MIKCIGVYIVLNADPGGQAKTSYKNDSIVLLRKDKSVHIDCLHEKITIFNFYTRSLFIRKYSDIRTCL